MATVEHNQSSYAEARLKDELHKLDPIEQNHFWVWFNSSTSHIEPSMRQVYLLQLLEEYMRNRQTSRSQVHQVHPHSQQERQSTSIPSLAPPAYNPIPAPKMVGDYILKKTIGQGTFGKVKLAEHIHTGQLVAVKVIEKANVKTHKQRNSVQREVRLMKLLSHPHIVQVLDIIENNDQIYIIMEYASGGELFDYIVSHGMVKEKEARMFFRQVLSAVDYCHRNSIIHRDLKPENLLLDSNKNIKIIDFGFGNTFHRERTLDTYCGSPFYAAPEMIKGVRYVGPEVDIWSLGVILFALLSGRLPFDASTMSELYERISKGHYVAPNHFSEPAKNLIQRMLQVDPRKRATLDEVMAHPWANEGCSESINNYLQPRPTVVTEPHVDSIRELVSYGIAEHEIRKLLASSVGLHPITSLYYLVEEARKRRNIKEICQQEQLKQKQMTLQRDGTLVNSTFSLENQYSNHKLQVESRPHHHMSISAPTTPLPSNQDSTTTLGDEELLSALSFTNNNNITTITASDAMVAHRNNRPRARLLNEDRPASALDRYQSTKGTEALPSSASATNTMANAGNSMTSPASSSGTSSGLRVVKGFFNVSTTSSKLEPEIFKEVERVLTLSGISYYKLTESFICEDTRPQGNKFEIEIIPVPGLVGVFGLNLKRLKGTVWSHKKLMNRLVEQMKL